MDINFTVNGIACSVPQEQGDLKLIDYLHDELQLVGTKFGCGIGICRACTVSVSHGGADVRTPTLGCSTPLSALQGARVETIEGVATHADALDPIQVAFLKHFSFQCGYCAPGFVMATKIFLEEIARHPMSDEALEEAIHRALEGHVCRCTGYIKYVEAVRDLAHHAMKGEPYDTAI